MNYSKCIANRKQEIETLWLPQKTTTKKQVIN